MTTVPKEGSSHPKNYSPSDFLKKMNINENDIARRKEWLEFTEKDVLHLEELNSIAEGMDKIIWRLLKSKLNMPSLRKRLKARYPALFYKFS